MLLFLGFNYCGGGSPHVKVLCLLSLEGPTLRNFHLQNETFYHVKQPSWNIHNNVPLVVSAAM